MRHLKECLTPEAQHRYGAAQVPRAGSRQHTRRHLFRSVSHKSEDRERLVESNGSAREVEDDVKKWREEEGEGEGERGRGRRRQPSVCM